jgi:hypothetical protein
MNTRIAIVFVAFVVIGGSYYVLNKWHAQRQLILDRCIGYDKDWIDMDDCYGVISISFNDNGKYDVLNQY